MNTLTLFLPPERHTDTKEQNVKDKVGVQLTGRETKILNVKGKVAIMSNYVMLCVWTIMNSTACTFEKNLIAFDISYSTKGEGTRI